LQNKVIQPSSQHKAIMRMYPFERRPNRQNGLFRRNPLRDKLYNLTYEEVRIIDQEIEEIISKEEYEKFEMQ